MKERNRFPQTASPVQRPSKEAQNLRKQAEGMPSGISRDDLLKKARQADTASQINNRPPSSDPQPPK
jgi:hypothetical protein